MRQWIMLGSMAVFGCNHPGGNTVENESQNAHKNHMEGTTSRSVSEPSNKPQPKTGAANSNPCLLQKGKEVFENRIRITGTEPFWSALVEGRCVTYSTPENQSGTRVWASLSGSWNSGRWSGSLGGKAFVLVTKPDPKCSDGMSDRRYPIAATLTIGDEKRHGCGMPE